MSKLVLPLVLLAALGTGCPTVDLGDDPPDPGQCRPSPVYFEDVIWPRYIKAQSDPAASCVDAPACHRREDGRSALRLEVPPPDQPDNVDYAANYAIVTRFLNCGSPESSSLLTKPLSGIDAHGGGDLINGPASPLYNDFLQWFAAP